MIDETFVQAIEELAKRANGVELLAAGPFEPPETYYLKKPDGTVERQAGPRPKEQRQFANLDSLTDWGWLAEHPAAWVSLDEVRVTIEDERHSWGKMPVGLSPQMKCLMQLERAPTPLDQRKLVMLLRTTLAGCCSPSLIAVFRNLKLTRNEAGEQEYQHQKQNIGKKLEAQVTGSDAIPETIIFTVPVVANPFLPVQTKTVNVAVEVDANSGTFTLHILPLELEKARQSAEIDLYRLVVDAVQRNAPLGEASVPKEEDESKSPEGFPVYSGKAEAA